MEVGVDWLAIVIATAIAMAVGAVWYGPLFGNRWMKLVGLKQKDVEQNWQKPMLFMLVLAFVQAYILSVFIILAGNYSDDIGAMRGAMTGFWLWLGIAVPIIVGNNMFARRSNNLTYIESGNALVTLILMGSVIGAML